MPRVSRVLVTGVGGRSVGHQILSALKRAGAGYFVVATDADAFSFGLYIADARYVVPTAQAPEYLSALLRIIERERVEAILPGTESELRVLASARHELESRGCAVIASDRGVIDLCLNKAALPRWLAQNGFDTPDTASGDGWEALVARTGFPIVGKPAEDSGGSKGVALLATKDEVRGYLADSARLGRAIILQEYVGTPESEYTVGVLVDRAGALIDSIVLHRNLLGLSLGASRTIDGRAYALSTGYSQGFIETNPRVAEVCESLALKLGVRGPVNVQLRIHGDAVKIFEVHPRFSGTTSIRSECGFNEPDVLLRNYLHGETFGRLDYQRDVAAIRAFQTVIVPVAEIQRLTRAGRTQ
jgi:carbamoyl-phosphate synthase large subunit